MYKVGVINDTHLGLKTEKIDRTEEIFGIYKQFAKHCKKTGVNAIVICGDIFDKNNPSEDLVAVFISIMNMLSQLQVPVYVVVGNHDAIADPEHLSCLSFVKKLKKRYPNFILIEDITCIEIEVEDLGPLYFTFLPHISKALLEKKKSKLSTHEYISRKSEAILKRVGQGSQHLVFSHLNVKGVHAGSEENLLRKSEVYVPELLTNTPKHTGHVQPEIIQAHIHKKQKIGNIHIIGSPLFCGFGEDVTDRYFAIVNQPNRLGEKFSIDYIPTNCKKFYEIELNISGKEKEDFHEIEEIKTFLTQVEPESIIKVNPTVHGDHAGYDWSKVRDKIGKLSKSYVKEIVPKIIRKKVIRDIDQKPNLPPKKAVYVWLKRNRPTGAKRKNELAKEYIEKHL
jgi:DNA repair exonuclease SbcCD nuclease subunit